MRDGDLRALDLAVAGLAAQLPGRFAQQEEATHARVRVRQPTAVGVRGERAAEAQVAGSGERTYAAGHLPGGLNVPHTELRGRLDEVVAAAAGRPVRVHCASGFRSYLAHRVLDHAGIDSANLSGGLLTLQATRPDVELVTD